MNAITDHPYQLRLMPRGLYEIADVAGLQLACNEGSVWITLDDDPRDIVLEAGERFCGTEHRRALLYAFASSELVVAPLARPAVPAPAQAVSRFARSATLLDTSLGRSLVPLHGR